MEEDVVGRREYEECIERIEAEDHRQNRRLDELEGTMKQISALTISVERIATSVQTLAKEIARHSSELEALKSIPAKKWDALVYGILGAIAGAIGTAFFNAVFK